MTQSNTSSVKYGGASVTECVWFAGGTSTLTFIDDFSAGGRNTNAVVQEASVRSDWAKCDKTQYMISSVMIANTSPM